VHRVPRCLRNTWTSRFDSWSLRWVFWFILAGRGASISKAGALFGWRVSTRVIHRLSLAPDYRSAQEYELSLRLPNCQLRWGPKGWDQEWQTEEGAVWTMTELLSGKQLFQEGEAMSNCVASYAQRCAFGDCAIFSLRCGGTRRLTVEINPSTRSIVQAKGPRNCMPSAEEAARLLDWQDGRFANSR
jgi:hypothetical protein